MALSGRKNEIKEMLLIDIQSSNRVATFYCAGRLVYGLEVEMLRNLLKSRTEDELRIDLSAVTAIDAAGLGLLVESQNWAATTQRALTLLDLSENVWRLVILTKLCASLEVSYSDLIALNPEKDECDPRQLIA
jgi:anti-anti-sigma regulatory factor